MFQLYHLTLCLGFILIFPGVRVDLISSILTSDAQHFESNTNSTIPLDAGLYVQIAQRGLDYATNLSEQMLPLLMVNYTIPDNEGSTYKLTRLVIDRFDRPTISAKFIRDEGVSATLFLPQVVMSGRYEGGFGWWFKKGKFIARVTNLNLTLTLEMNRGPNDEMEFDIPICNGSTSEILIAFAGDWSAMLNTIRSLAEEYLLEELDTILCNLTVQATKMLGEEATRSAQNARTNTLNIEPSFLCGGKVKQERRRQQEDGLTDHFDMNFGLLTQPQISEDRALISMNGGLDYRGIQARNVDRPVVSGVPEGEKMISFLLTEYPPNTFFRFLYTQRLGDIQKVVSAEDLPGAVKSAALLLCWSCEVRMLAGLTSAPRLMISQDGVTLFISGEVRMIFDGDFKQVEIVSANVSMDITVKPTVRRSTIYGDVSLTRVNVDVKRVGLGGVVGKPLSDMLERLIPKQIWPHLKRRLRFALNRRGIKLPVVCGVELRETDLRYLEHGIFIDTDFDYNSRQFIRRFRREMRSHYRRPHRPAKEIKPEDLERMSEY